MIRCVHLSTARSSPTESHRPPIMCGLGRLTPWVLRGISREMGSACSSWRAAFCFGTGKKPPREDLPFPHGSHQTKIFARSQTPVGRLDAVGVPYMRFRRCWVRRPTCGLIGGSQRVPAFDQPGRRRAVRVGLISSRELGPHVSRGTQRARDTPQKRAFCVCSRELVTRDDVGLGDLHGRFRPGQE
jgi:hypothetical protein